MGNFSVVINPFKSKKWVFFFVCVLFSSIALYFTFRNIPFSEFFLYVKGINYYLCIPSGLAVFISFVFRGLRWQIILSETADLHFCRVYHPMMIGFMLNFILPGRVGELARPSLLKKNDNVPFTTGVATIVVERVFDILFIVVFFSIFMGFTNINPQINVEFAGYVLETETLIALVNKVKIGFFFLCVLIILLMIDGIRNSLPKLIFRICISPWLKPEQETRLHNLIWVPLVGIMDNLVQGFSTVKNPLLLGKCFIYSFIIWAMVALSQYMMVIACPGIGLNFFESFAVLVVICFFITLPSVPGYWGLWEAGGIFAMFFFGITGTHALGFVLVNHVVQFFSVLCAGIVSVIIYGVPGLFSVSGK